MGACFSCVERDIEVDIPNRLNSAFHKLYIGDESSYDDFTRIGLESIQNGDFEYATEACVGMYLSKKHENHDISKNYLRDVYTKVAKYNLIRCYNAIAEESPDEGIFREILEYEDVNQSVINLFDPNEPYTQRSSFSSGVEVPFIDDMAVIMAYWAVRQYNDALLQCDRILERGDLYEYRLVQINLLKAQILFDKNDHEEAKVVIEDVPSKFQNYVEVQILKSKISFHSGDHEEAMSILRPLSPKYSNSLFIKELHNEFNSQDLKEHVVGLTGEGDIIASEV